MDSFGPRETTFNGCSLDFSRQNESHVDHVNPSSNSARQVDRSQEFEWQNLNFMATTNSKTKCHPSM